MSPSPRTYERTHSWLKFSLDLRQAPAQLWILLGEGRSKCEHIAGMPLRPDVAEYLHRLYLAKGSQATTAIEGNTLSEQEVLLHLEGKLELPPSKQYLQQEVDNIIQACNKIIQQIQAGATPRLDPATIKDLNRMVLQGLELPPEVAGGEIRRHEVGVARYHGAPHQDCEHLLQRLCEWMSSETFRSPAGMEMVYAFLKSILAHLYLAWIHPFGDGNGRTARLVEFVILIGAGVPTPAAHLLSNHYNQTRSEYYRQLDQASRTGGEVIPFLTYAIQGLVDGLRSQIETIRYYQWAVLWENYVHLAFKNKRGASMERRRELVLALTGKFPQSVALAQLGDLSPHLVLAYSKLTRKALARDINALLKMGLAEKGPEGVKAKMETILTFLPLAARFPEKESANKP